MIGKAGLALSELPSRGASPAEDEVGYVFSENDNNTVQWFAKGWIDAAATDPRDFEVLE